MLPNVYVSPDYMNDLSIEMRRRQIMEKLDDKAAVIHVRSASRLGVRDFNVNRARIESLRAQLAK